ncbi:hypothetical protein WJX73_006490 [Symbiochloris irregularis]|uniref:CID domain-containing protein n=1 Tax=Symbiochloris irregularis TaxID=706552 RepID=A0AAW1NTF7_9CHLO
MSASGSGFQPEALQAKLAKLNATQQSIETVSAYCIFYRKDARKVVSTWEVEYFNRSPDLQKKLALMYLANDVLQNSRKKGPQYVQEFYRSLPKVIRHILKHGDASVHRAVTRLLNIWEERKVFAPLNSKPFLDLISEAQGLKSGSAANGRSSSGSGATTSQAAKAVEPMREALQTIEGAVSSSQSLSQRAAPALSQEWVGSTDLESLGSAGGMLRQYIEALQAEVTQRDHLIGLLRALLGTQESEANAGREKLVLCHSQMALIDTRLASAPKPDVAAAATDSYRPPSGSSAHQISHPYASAVSAASQPKADEEYSPTMEMPVASLGPSGEASWGAPDSQQPYTPSGPPEPEYSPFGMQPEPAMSAGMGPESGQRSRDPRDPRQQQGAMSHQQPPLPAAPPLPDHEPYSPGDAGDMDTSASLSSHPAASYPMPGHLGTYLPQPGMPEFAGEEAWRHAGNGTGHEQLGGESNSAAADMARQLAARGMTTDELLEALASLPKDSLTSLNFT